MPNDRPFSVWIDLPFPVWLVLWLLGTVALAWGVTLVLNRLGSWKWFAVLIGTLLPAAMIVGVFFFLESRQPYGPSYAIIGLAAALPALIVGFFVALVVSSDMAWVSGRDHG